MYRRNAFYDQPNLGMGSLVTGWCVCVSSVCEQLATPMVPRGWLNGRSTFKGGRSESTVFVCI